MKVEVTSKNLNLTAGQMEWIERRLQFALGRFTPRIHRVSVVVTDVNGTRGGIDKQCRLHLWMTPGGEMTIEAIDATVEAAAAGVAERASRAVSRLLSRIRDVQFRTERVAS